MNTIPSLLWFCWLCVICNAFEYAVVLDCGSKGTRMHIYRRVSNDNILDILPSPKKIVPGLSHFGKSPSDSIDYLFPLLTHAATIIPPEAHGEYDREVAMAAAGGLRGGGVRGSHGQTSVIHTLPVFPSTEVFILGTAGLRLLTQDQEDKLFDTVVQGLNDRRGPVSSGGQPFMIRRHQIVTLSGAAEAYYAALSVNFILGTIDANLRRTYPTDAAITLTTNNSLGGTASSSITSAKSSSDKPHQHVSGGHLRLVGAMDLGGASTQIIFPVRKDSESADTTSSLDSVNTKNFWAASYLHYGSITIHSRLLRYLATHHVTDISQRGGQSEGDFDDLVDNIHKNDNSLLNMTRGGILIHNPCDMVQHTEYWNGPGSTATSKRPEGHVETLYEFIGTGDAAGCSLILRRILWGKSNPFQKGSNFQGSSSSKGGSSGGGLGLDGVAAVQRSAESSGSMGTSSGIIGGSGISYMRASSDLVCVGGAPCPLEGIDMPRIPKGSTFVCMSALYRAVNALYLYAPSGLSHFPRPSLLEVQRATESFCAMKWSSDQFEDAPDADELPRVCLHAVYAFTLMRDAYGLDLESRDMLFAHSLGGHEISWVIGAALSQFSSFDHVEKLMLSKENVNKISEGYLDGNDNDDDLRILDTVENQRKREKQEKKERRMKRKSEIIFKKEGHVIHRSDLDYFKHIRYESGGDFMGSLASVLSDGKTDADLLNYQNNQFSFIRSIQYRWFSLKSYIISSLFPNLSSSPLPSFLVVFVLILMVLTCLVCVKRCCQLWSSRQRCTSHYIYPMIGRVLLCLPLHTCCPSRLSRSLSSSLNSPQLPVWDKKRTKSDDDNFFDRSL